MNRGALAALVVMAAVVSCTEAVGLLLSRLQSVLNEVDAGPYAQAAHTFSDVQPCAPCDAGGVQYVGGRRGGRGRGSDSSDDSDDSNDSDDSSDSSDSSDSRGHGRRRTIVNLSCPEIRPEWCASGKLTNCGCCPTCLIYRDIGESCAGLADPVNAKCRPPALCINNVCSYP